MVFGKIIDGFPCGHILGISCQVGTHGTVYGEIIMVDSPLVASFSPNDTYIMEILA